mmetsp:Transcript_11874/g.35842  ORF Transcript_11874/g.35842 Transcript_11874/m.35842 type:complete len:379 (-) Transcript_11874:44-1180(-)
MPENPTTHVLVRVRPVLHTRQVAHADLHTVPVADDADMGPGGAELLRADAGVRAAHGRQQRGLASVGHADKSALVHQPKLELQLCAFPWSAPATVALLEGLGAKAADTTLGGNPSVARPEELVPKLRQEDPAALGGALTGVDACPHDGAHRHLQTEVLCVLAAVCVLTVTAVRCLDQLRNVQEALNKMGSPEVDGTAMPTVAGPLQGGGSVDVGRRVPTVACFHLQPEAVDEGLLQPGVGLQVRRVQRLHDLVRRRVRSRVQRTARRTGRHAGCCLRVHKALWAVPYNIGCCCSIGTEGAGRCTTAGCSQPEACAATAAAAAGAAAPAAATRFDALELPSNRNALPQAPGKDANAWSSRPCDRGDARGSRRCGVQHVA